MTEITARTVHGRLLLRPSAEINDVIIGVLGRAQRRYAMTLHAAVFLSNHFHLLASPDSPQQLARFMEFLDGNLAREVGRLVGWREKVWARRYQAIPVSDEEPAQIARLAYILAHGVKEGFVARPEQWPGVHCVTALRDGAALVGTWYDRTAAHRSRRTAKLAGESGATPAVADLEQTEQVVFAVLPCWADLPPEVVRARVTSLVEEIVVEGREARRGRPPLGRATVLRQHPHQRPERSKRSPAPAVHAASRAMRLAFRAAYAEFAAIFREAANRLRGGDLLARFPPGAFPPAMPCHAPS